MSCESCGGDNGRGGTCNACGQDLTDYNEYIEPLNDYQQEYESEATS